MCFLDDVLTINYMLLFTYVIILLGYIKHIIALYTYVCTFSALRDYESTYVT